MDKQDVLDHYGGVVKTARALGFNKSTISNWHDELPIRLQAFIELASKGKLKADRTLIPEPVSRQRRAANP